MGNNQPVTDALTLANVEALTSGSENDTEYCPGGRIECVRVNTGSTVHIFYEP
jgi:hypothetical protein